MSQRAPEPRRNVVVFGATSFLNDTASEMAYWILPAFLTSIGGGPAQLGIIEGIAESVASLAKLGSGYLTDRTPRRKPLVVVGYVLANIVKPLLAVATSWWQVLVIRFADRTGKGLRGAPRDVMVGESVPSERVGSAFGLLQAMDSAGAIVGPLLAMLLVTQMGFRGVFWAAAVPGVLAILVVSLFARETGGRAVSLPPSIQAASRVPLPRRFYWVLAAVMVFSIGNSSDMFLILRAQEAGIAATLAPLLGLVFNVMYTMASWPAGRLSDRLPKPMIVAGGYGIFAVTYAVFATAPSQIAIWIGMGTYGLYYAFTNPVLRALVVEAVPAAARGRAFGIFYFWSSLAALLSSAFTGWLWDAFGAQLPLGISSGLAAAAALMLLLTPRLP